MKSLQNLGMRPAGIPILADDILEFHAARLLLLFKICGTANRIDGLTKMAKLDFFVRYPQFFDAVCQHLGQAPSIERKRKFVEASMVRFHYGPWDQRYYHILGYLEAKGLLTVEREGSAYRLRLTDKGRSVAAQIERKEVFAPLIGHMKRVKEVLGNKAGSTLKHLVYQVFGEEIRDLRFGEVIT